MLKKLKSLFIVEVDDKDQPKSKHAPKVQDVPSTNNKISSEPSPKTNTGKPNKRFIDVLFKALEKHNLEGLDYIEFKESLKSLDGVIQDEETKYKSAFAMGKSMGLSKDKLLKSGEYYINILKEENQKFQKTYQKQKDLQVESKENDIASLKQGISNRKKQIEQLQGEITKMEAQLDKELKSMDASTDKLEQTKSSFEASYMTLLQQIQADFDKIKQYIDS